MGKRYLSQLRPGEKGWVKELQLENGIARRLEDMGLVEGSCVECVFTSPLGDPKAYLIKGALIAIRNVDAHNITLNSSLGR